ncbi:MAG: alpha/beta hydrolase, partial [Granulicella sp.]
AILPLAMLMCMPALSPAQTPAPASPATTANTVPLWPNGAPGAFGGAPEDQPTLTIYLPASNPTQTGVVVAPGGGYLHLSMTKEGSDIAEWLNQHGIAAFVLKYRLGPKYHNPIEIGDAQRALRTVRSQAASFGIASNHLGIWGFSAGGHLAATAGTKFDAGNPASADPIEQQSSRPDFMILAYPVITMKAPYAHVGSVHGLLGTDPSPALVDSMSAELNVTPQTPPTFLYTTTDDKTVPVMNSIMFFEALSREKVPVEMHIFEHGSHGSGLGGTSPSLTQWPPLLHTWMQVNGWAQ